jgi:hypothetical protein
MSNPNNPFGLRCVGRIDGAPPNFGVHSQQVAGTATAIFTGDPVTIGGALGTMSQAAVVPGGAQVAGVADGNFDWVSKVFGSRVYRAYWPGTGDSVGTTFAGKVNVDPLSVYEIQCLNNSGAGAVTQASVGKYANFNAGAGGNTANGMSSYALDDTTITTVQGNLPLKIIDIVQSPKSDPTSAFNIVKVQLVNLNAGV